jgi:hypothetical protein
MELSEIFWSFFVGTVASLIFGLVRACLKSKCDNIQICCIHIHRNVQLEEKEHEFDVKNNVQSPRGNNDNNNFQL